MPESTKTLKALREEGLGLAQKAQAIFAKGEDATPEERALAVKAHQDSVAIADRIDQSLAQAPDVKALSERYDAYARPDRPHFGGGGSPQSGHEAARAAVKSIGQQFIESASYKAFQPRVQGSGAGLDIPGLYSWRGETKATFTTAGSTLTQYDRPPGLILVEQQRLMVADLLGRGTTTMNTIRYPQEDTFTNAATTVAEGALKPEASFDLSEADAPVRKIAVTAKVTDELFADFEAMRSYIDGRLRFMVDQREEAQLLNGDGVAPNLLGILPTTGIQTQAKSTDTNLDAIHKAITKVRSVGFYEPDGAVIHPTDYQILRLSKDANNQYYGGGPFTGAYGVGGVQEQPGVWGLRTVVTTAIAAGTALVGAFRIGAMVFRREGVSVQMTNSNEDDFRKNLLTLRAECRLALAVWRPKAFCTVTGIA